MKPMDRLTPGEIEKRSMEIIAQELGDRALDPENEAVIRRVIHTTADFDYADNLVFTPHIVSSAVELLRAGGFTIVTDTRMAFSGVNAASMEKLGGTVRCFMSDPDVAAEARAQGCTRASVCMDRAADIAGPLIIAVGNAPTALMRLCELMEEKKIRPALVVGVPVGFVHVVESKEMLLQSGAPCIVARGRKGGSNVAAAILNALLYQAVGRTL